MTANADFTSSDDVLDSEEFEQRLREIEERASAREIEEQKARDDKGYIYLLSNPSSPGIVKIGRSIKGGKGRANDLYRNDTGVITPFVLEFEVFVEDHKRKEKSIHKFLNPVRVNFNREFFRMSIPDAISLIADFCIPKNDYVDHHSCVSFVSTVKHYKEKYSDDMHLNTFLELQECVNRGWIKAEPLGLGDHKITVTPSGDRALTEWLDSIEGDK